MDILPVKMRYIGVANLLAEASRAIASQSSGALYSDLLERIERALQDATPETFGDHEPSEPGFKVLGNLRSGYHFEMNPCPNIRH